MCGGEIIYSTRVKADGGFLTALPEYSSLPEQVNNETRRAGSERRAPRETLCRFLICLPLDLGCGFLRAK